ncbi:MAG: 3-dehydroquinate synthase II [Candidatus Bathyarchaeia archaeon]
MRELWARIDPAIEEAEKRRLIEATSRLCDAYLLDEADIPHLKALAALTVSAAPDADILLCKSLDEAVRAKAQRRRVALIANVESSQDVAAVTAAANASIDYVVIRCGSWEVIPLENLIAGTRGRTRLLAALSDAERADLLLAALEVGVDGLLLEKLTVEAAKQAREAIESVKTRVEEKEKAERLPLTELEVSGLVPLGLGARVCIDTCDLMKPGEGLLVGCQSSCLFLVEAEVSENPFVEPRPFRVNAGPVSHYALVPGGKTKYLSEVKAGDQVLIVNREGVSRPTNVCRAKVEWRPLILLEARWQGKPVKAIVQNAETIRFVTPEGSRSVAELKPGDRVLARLEEGGRHFGALVKEESVIER